MAVTFQNDWQTLLADEFQKDYYKQLHDFLKQEYRTQTIYPDMYDIFNCLHGTAYKDVKVVIIGQDPYHGPGQAHGYSFSVRPGIPAPPSLVNIYKELMTDVGCTMPTHGYLKEWADQGVLMLNAVLTVRAGQAGSHRNKGWEHFTDHIISLLNDREDPIIFLLWGRYARDKKALISNPRHCVLEAAHPSPLSAYNGFFGCHHFSKANAMLVQMGKEPIDWQIH